MVNHEMRLTTGEFAKLHHINKRTLHYYDSIGLFSPAGTGENGYRYYTYLQSAALEMLLTMRELSMSLKDIDGYMKNRSPAAFHKILSDKTEEIDESVKRLKEIRKLLAAKERQLCLCEEHDMDEIDIIDCGEEYLLLSKSITGTYDDDDFAVFIEHAHALHDHRLFNKSYGSMISAETLTGHNFEDYDCFFTKVENGSKKSGLFVKPRGRYLRAFCKGDWDRLPAAYERVLAFVAERGLKLVGYSYEEGLNEMAISSSEEYVTQITIMCE
ncbi:MAG: MerR family transcriptional regulator [Oscillospiraceae bacterium]